SVEICGCTRVAMGSGLSRCPLARNYLGRRRELSSRFKQPSRALADSNLGLKISVLPAVSIDAAVFARSHRLRGMAPCIPELLVSLWQGFSQGDTPQVRRVRRPS